MTGKRDNHASFETFRARRRVIKTGEDPAALDSFPTDAVFAVGILLGGDYPHAAAAVSALADLKFPEERFPWSDGL